MTKPTDGGAVLVRVGVGQRPFRKSTRQRESPDWPGFSLLLLGVSTWLGDGGRHGSYADTTVSRTYLHGLSSGCRRIFGGHRKEKAPTKMKGASYTERSEGRAFAGVPLGRGTRRMPIL